jgi:uncharacterized membrane protein
MGATVLVILLWVGFAATHMGLSTAGIRPQLVERLGARGFLGVYSLISFAFFIPLVWFYLTHKHAGPMFWSIALGPIGRWVFYVLAGVALTLAAAGLMQPSPVSLAGGTMDVRGVARLTRHPLFMGFGLLGLLHLIPNGFASDVAFFSGLPLFAIIGCWHQDQRKLANGPPGYRDFVAATPFIPFTRPGAARGIQELGLVRIVIGIAVTALIRWYHQTLFG